MTQRRFEDSASDVAQTKKDLNGLHQHAEMKYSISIDRMSLRTFTSLSRGKSLAFLVDLCVSSWLRRCWGHLSHSPICSLEIRQTKRCPKAFRFLRSYLKQDHQSLLFSFPTNSPTPILISRSLRPQSFTLLKHSRRSHLIILGRGAVGNVSMVLPMAPLVKTVRARPEYGTHLSVRQVVNPLPFQGSLICQR